MNINSCDCDIFILSVTVRIVGHCLVDCQPINNFCHMYVGVKLLFGEISITASTPSRQYLQIDHYFAYCFSWNADGICIFTTIFMRF